MTETRNLKAQPFSPDFANPPVVETALSFQIAELARWTAVHPGLYFETIRDRYPNVRQETPIPPIVEMFPPSPRTPELKLLRRPDQGRVIYASSDHSSLLQVQQTRFGYNWKKAEEDSKYPRFEENSVKFLAEFDAFNNFCDAEGIGLTEPTFCEVVYVNHIRPRESESIADLFAEVFSEIPSTRSRSKLPEIETLAFNRTFELGKQRGRLYAEVAVAIDDDGPAFLHFKLTSRLRHESDGLEATLQETHDWLTTAFVDLTSERCRLERWGQSNEQ